MSEHIFKSTLTEEQIKKNFEKADFFENVMSGLDEALAYEKGVKNPATIERKRKLPQIDIAATRKELNMSQKKFASVIGVSVRTVEAWESGRTNPSPTAKNLIFLINSDPSLINKLQNT